MSQRQDKKLRQFYRRDLREKFGLDATILEAMLRGKPRFFPGFAWKWLARFYFMPEFHKRLFYPEKE